MNRWEALSRKIIISMYVLGLFGMLVIVIAILMTRQYDTRQHSDDSYMNISGCWTLDREGTRPVDLNQLGEYMDEETGMLSIYYRLPQMDEDTSLLYRTKDVYTKVLIDDRVLYETDVYSSGFYNRSPGNLWNITKFSAVWG